MAMYLVISDGTTTVTIADGSGGATNYILERGTWSPQIAGLRRSQLAGRGPYEEVVEEMRLHITGSTVAAALANLGALVGLLEQAERWYKGSSDAAVLLKYSPDGATTSSSGTPLQAAIYGRAPGDGTGVTLPVNFDDAGGSGWVVDVTIRFRRKGEWAHASNTQSSSATTNGNLITVAMGAAIANAGPTLITLTQFYDGDDASVFYKPGFLAIAEASTDIEILAVEGLATGPLTSVSDSTKYARDTNVLRYTPIATTGVFSAAGTISSTSLLLAAYANVRSNSGGVNYYIQADIRSPDSPDPSGANPGKGSVSLSNPILIPDTVPRWVFLGMLKRPTTQMNYFRLLAKASAASGSCDIDSVVLVGLDNPNNTVLEFARGYQHVSTYGTTENLSVDPRTLTSPNSLVRTVTSGTLRYFPLTLLSSPYIYTKATSLYMLHMATGGGSTADRWRYENSAAVLTQTATAIRYSAYLSPE